VHIVVEVGHLVLDRLPIAAGTGRIVERAIRTELARLLGDGGLPHPAASTAALESVTATAAVAPSSEPGTLGRQIGAAVYSGVGKTAGEP